MVFRRLWFWGWSQAGSVPIRWKVIGIVVTSQLVVGLSIAWWVRTSLGQWLSYLLGEDRVMLAMDAGLRGVIVVTILAAVAGLILAWLLTLVLTYPLLQLAQLARRVAGGELSVRSPVWANDEIGYLARSFNSMIDALEESNVALVKSNAEASASNEELRRLLEDLRQKEEMRVSLMSRVVHAQEEERHRLSRELHDSAGQMLASLLVHMKLIERAADLEVVRERTAELRELVVSTLEETRRLSMDLRPAGLDELGLVGALEWFARAFERETGIEVALFAEGLEGRRLARPMEIQLYRIVQEMLTNVTKHARAAHVEVKLLLEENRLELRVEDDGIGFDDTSAMKSTGHGLGLLTMRERAELLGGAFRLSSAPGHGTRIEISVPASLEATS